MASTRRAAHVAVRAALAAVAGLGVVVLPAAGTSVTTAAFTETVRLDMALTAGPVGPAPVGAGPGGPADAVADAAPPGSVEHPAVPDRPAPDATPPEPLVEPSAAPDAAPDALPYLLLDGTEA